jgi:hypothetical protein
VHAASSTSAEYVITTTAVCVNQEKPLDRLDSPCSMLVARDADATEIEEIADVEWLIQCVAIPEK